MGRKVEMIKVARTQKRLAKLQQQNMKQQNRAKTAPRQFVDKKHKINKVKKSHQYIKEMIKSCKR